VNDSNLKFGYFLQDSCKQTPKDCVDITT